MGSDRYSIRRHATAAEFLAHSGAWLSAREAEDNVILGVARSHSQRSGAEGASAEYWATVLCDGEIAGCAFRTPPYQLYLTDLPAESIEALGRDVLENHGRICGVGGPVGAARQFAQQWSKWHTVSGRERLHLRIHKLTRVRMPARLPAGALRRIADAESGLILDWSRGFIADTGIDDAPERMAERLTESEALYFWEDEGPRCMVAATRDLPNGVCINAVYTPPRWRGRGYATAAVASLSRNLLESGKSYCCLYTDVDNPTSNSIYSRIGYRPIREDINIDFSEGPVTR